MKRLLLALGCALTLATAAEAAPFSKADADHDGAVTFAEAQLVMPQLTQVHFNKFAQNGVVTKGRWPGLSNFYDVMYRRR
jgi:hypothetical protein